MASRAFSRPENLIHTFLVDSSLCFSSMAAARRLRSRLVQCGRRGNLSSFMKRTEPFQSFLLYRICTPLASEHSPYNRRGKVWNDPKRKSYSEEEPGWLKDLARLPWADMSFCGVEIKFSFPLACIICASSLFWNIAALWMNNSDL